MAEPARKLDVDAPEHQPSKRTKGALGKVVDLSAYQKRRAKPLKQQKTPPASAEADRKPAVVVSLDAEREKRKQAAQTQEQKLAPVVSLETKKKKRRLKAQKAAEAATPKGALGPMPHSTPLQMATSLGAAQARDRLTATPTEEVLPAGTDERVFLELDPRSYALREQTVEQKEKRRQASMMDVAKRFSAPSGEAVGDAEEGEAFPEEPAENAPERPPRMEPRQQAQMMGRLQQGMARDRMAFEQNVASARNLGQEAMQQRQALIKANKSIRRTAKLIQAAGIETIIPLITLILQLNLETINKWIFKIEIPGIILVEANPSLDATDFITILVDFLLVFAVLIVFLQTAFFIILGTIIWTGFVDILSSLLEVFSGLF